LVLLDAMVLGKPIVATRTNGTRDYLQHGETAWMVEPRDPEALAVAIEGLWKDALLAEELSENAMEVSARAFTNGGFLRRIYEACEALTWEDRAEEEGGIEAREGPASEGLEIFD
jgi:glycosyltransferase involved in cell wall biosynthesis